MAFARVYVGAHFPLDVLAGLAVGAVVALLVQRARASSCQAADPPGNQQAAATAHHPGRPTTDGPDRARLSAVPDHTSTGRHTAP